MSKRKVGQLECCVHRQHEVLFYDTEEYLCSSIAQFAAAGLLKGEAVILALKSHHWARINEQLNEVFRVSVHDCIEKKQLIVFDALDLIKEYDSSGIRKESIALKTLLECGETFPGVRGCGEMVDILTSWARVEDAIASERMWHKLMDEVDFDLSLLCPYPMLAFGCSRSELPFETIVSLHSRVSPSERLAIATDIDEHMRLIANLRQKAAALENEVRAHENTARELETSNKALALSNQQLAKANMELQQANETLHATNEDSLKAREEAQAASRAKSDFLANMSHELRTPLTSIIGFTQLMSNDLNTDRAKALVEHELSIEAIQNSGTQLKTLIDGLLDLSKVEAGKMTTEAQQFVVSEFVRALHTELKVLASAKNIALNFFSEIDSSVAVMSDPMRLRQIMMNIIGNAIKFTSKGSVDVSFQLLRTRGSSSSLECTVTDSGVGISEATATQLFQPFTQANESTARTFGGTGLGLHLSRELARLLGGDVTLVSSTPDVGSTFSVSVPVSQVRSNSLQTLTNSPFAQVRHKLQNKDLSVLIADDNHFIRRLLQQAVQSAGITNIGLAVDGLSALNLLSEQQFDIVLLDITMPKMDGYEACREMRQLYSNRPNTPHPVVIALTACAMPGDREKCLAAGMDDYLSKPIDMSSLSQKLEHWGLRVLQKRPPQLDL